MRRDFAGVADVAGRFGRLTVRRRLDVANDVPSIRQAGVAHGPTVDIDCDWLSTDCDLAVGYSGNLRSCCKPGAGGVGVSVPIVWPLGASHWYRGLASRS